MWVWRAQLSSAPGLLVELGGLVGVSGQNVCMQAAVTRQGWLLPALGAAGLVLGCVRCGHWCRNNLERNGDHFFLHLLCDHHCPKEACLQAGWFWGNGGGLDRIWYPKHSQGSSWTWQSNWHRVSEQQRRVLGSARVQVSDQETLSQPWGYRRRPAGDGQMRRAQPSGAVVVFLLGAGCCGTCGPLGLRSFLSAPHLLDCLVPEAAIWDLQCA